MKAAKVAAEAAAEAAAAAGVRVAAAPPRPGGPAALQPGARWAAREVILAQEGCSPEDLRLQGDFVSLSERADAGGALAALGECGDPGCGCNRMKRPESRGSFEGVVCRMALAAFGPHMHNQRRPLVYASLGSGLLLPDLILLERLLLAGFHFSAVVLVDTMYEEIVAAEKAVPGALWDPMRWAGASKSKHSRTVRAMNAFSEWFASDNFEVLALPSFQDYHQLCAHNPQAFCCDILVQMDAANPGGPHPKLTYLNTDPRWPAELVKGSLFGDSFQARDVKGCVLRQYGLFASLSNLGAHGADAEETGRPSDFKDSWVCVEQKVPPESGMEGALRDFSGANFLIGAVLCDPGRVGAGLNPRNTRETQDQREAQRHKAQRLGLRIFRVVYPKVVIRSRPDLRLGKVVGLHRLGDEVLAHPSTVEDGGWVRLWRSSAEKSRATGEWMLQDGHAKGLGKLLEEVPLKGQCRALAAKSENSL